MLVACTLRFASQNTIVLPSRFSSLTQRSVSLGPRNSAVHISDRLPKYLLNTSSLLITMGDTPIGSPAPIGSAELSSMLNRLERLEGNAAYFEHERQQSFEWQKQMQIENERLRTRLSVEQGGWSTALPDVTQAVTAAVTKATRKKKAKVPAPTEYDGSKDKLPIFIKEVKSWLADNDVDDDQDRIRLTAAYMKKGDAAEWSTQQAEDGTTWPSYAAFLLSVQHRFGDLDPKYTARQKLMKTKQIEP